MYFLQFTVTDQDVLRLEQLEASRDVFKCNSLKLKAFQPIIIVTITIIIVLYIYFLLLCVLKYFEYRFDLKLQMVPC